MALHRFHEVHDLLGRAAGIAGLRHESFLGHDLADQFDGVRPVQRAQFAFASALVERGRQWFARGEHQPRARVGGEKLAAEGEDGGEGVIVCSPAFRRLFMLRSPFPGPAEAGTTNREHALAVVQDDDRCVVAQGAFDGLERLVEALELGDGVFVAVGQELVADRIEHGARVAVLLQADKDRAREAGGAGEPAGQFGGERGLALAAGAAHDRPGLLMQQAFQRQQFPAAALEFVRRFLRQAAEAELAFPRLELPDLPGGNPGDELRVVLFLVDDGHEPVLEPQLARAHDLAAFGVVVERALARQHRSSDARAVRQFAVERLHKATGRLDQHAVAHGDDGGDAFFEQARGDGRGRVQLGHGGLAGFEEDQRDAVLPEQPRQPRRINELHRALLQLVGVLGVFKAQPAEAEPFVIDAVAVEVDDIERLVAVGGLLQG